MSPDEEREVLEVLWVVFMIEHGWLTSTLEGSIITLVAYPGTQYSFTRTIDLRHEFPAMYKGQKNWADRPPFVDFDPENGLLAIGWEKNIDLRANVDTSAHLFVD